MSYNTCHSELMKILLDEGIIGSHLQRAFRRGFYPVVVGGTNVVRCAALSQKARKIAGSVYNNDIDIKFVITKEIKSNADPIVTRAHDVRMRFITDLLNDPRLNEAIEKVSRPHKGLSIKLVLTDMSDVKPTPDMSEDKRKSIEMLHRHIVKSITAQYWLKGELAHKTALLDTAIYSSYAEDMFRNYQTFFDHPMRHPIPFYMSADGTPYATCGWSYYDTVRMLMLSAEHYRSFPNGTYDKRFHYLKFLKYLAKFIVFYVQINRLKDEHKFDELKAMYERAKAVLSTNNIKDKTITDLTRAQRQLVHEMSLQLRQKTNLKRLEQVLRGVRPPTPQTLNRQKGVAPFLQNRIT